MMSAGTVGAASGPLLPDGSGAEPRGEGSGVANSANENTITAAVKTFVSRRVA